MSSYDLSRFHRAQEPVYAAALAEIRVGRKRSHWIWYIFPQLDSLGYSYNARYYGISGLEEAKAYLEDPLLRSRLEEISSALLALPCSDPYAVMGSPDDQKLCSCMTLFAAADPDCPIYPAVLDKFYHGRRDSRTLALL